ncbi:hypothetical protein D9615_005701 [Tricholomella constricta]|uniref:C2H2-type domain-containing protein n=1 Tax=Tricholomella constricta TaxID=117010 RepID=A0A8H5HA72_9AGAR|nr:hypothetical protein D9615_005701 [Tricholomella constricta]
MEATEPEVIDLTALSDSSEEEEEEDSGHEDELDDEAKSESDEETIEVPVDRTSRARLHEAIAAVSEERLRRILSHLVDTIPAVESALTHELVMLKRKTQDVISRWEACSNCDEEFDMGTRREEDECSFHPGELEVNEAEFVDWDEACHGPMDTADNRRSYPENFTWSCCEGNGMSEGCVRGMHRPLPRKKRRM